jgi:hypothetical protein
MRFGPAYYNAGQLQTVLFKTVCEEKTPARDVAQCTRAWIDLERLKREIRGIPPLAPAKLHELLADMKRVKRASESCMVAEVPGFIEANSVAEMPGS